jgi:hypothetical protein
MLQAFLLASSVVLMLGMCCALMALAAVRVRNESEPVTQPEPAPDI